MRVLRKLKKLMAIGKNRIRSIPRQLGYGISPKVFVIGRNKTGTTTLQVALHDLGYHVAPTDEGERLLRNWVNDDLQPVVDLCKRYDAFQDVPFSLSRTYNLMDEVFAGSKFVLTVRDDEHQWFNSLCRFHAKLFGRDGNLPDWNDLKNATYRYKGYQAESHRHVYQAEVHGLYNESEYKKHYLEHNKEVRNYFAGRDSDFIEINVKVANDYFRLCDFLGKPPQYEAFPWANKT